MASKARIIQIHHDLVEIFNLLSQKPTQPFLGVKHRGIDFGKEAHTPYRAVKKGKVTGIWHRSDLGYIVEVTSGVIRPIRIAYAHVLNPVKLNFKVSHAGGIIGEISGPNDNFASGTVTNGEHEHISLESSKGGYYRGEIGKNPTEFLRGERLAIKKTITTIEKSNYKHL